MRCSDRCGVAIHTHIKSIPKHNNHTSQHLTTTHHNLRQLTTRQQFNNSQQLTPTHNNHDNKRLRQVCDQYQRAVPDFWSRSASKTAEDALMVATRAAVHPRGTGNRDAPLVQGAHRERLPTGTSRSTTRHGDRSHLPTRSSSFSMMNADPTQHLTEPTSAQAQVPHTSGCQHTGEDEPLPAHANTGAKGHTKQVPRPKFPSPEARLNLNLTPA